MQVLSVRPLAVTCELYHHETARPGRCLGRGRVLGLRRTVIVSRPGRAYDAANACSHAL